MAHTMAKTTFRIATINVHGFINPRTNRNNAYDLASLLEPHKIDLLAIEEARNDESLKAFQEKLSLTNVIFGRSYTSSDGNAVLSRYAFAEHHNQISDHHCRGGTRAMIQFQLQGDHPFIQNRKFAVTHLDHINEDDRVVQMTTFGPHRHNIHVLMGDMNAVTREDYSDRYYQDVVYQKRQQARWELPRFNLTRMITDSYGYRDAFREANPQLKDEQVATCPYGTRIDYIFYRPIEHDHWSVRQCVLLDTLRFTDHRAVLAEFEASSK